MTSEIKSDASGAGLTPLLVAGFAGLSVIAAALAVRYAGRGAGFLSVLLASGCAAAVFAALKGGAARAAESRAARDVLLNAQNEAHATAIAELRAGALALEQRHANSASGALESAAEIEEAVEETASLIAHINGSIAGINGEVEHLVAAVAGVGIAIGQTGASVERVADSAGKLHDVSSATASTVNEMSASIRQVAESADSVQSMAEESAAAMVEMDRAIHEVTQHVVDAASLTHQVSESAAQGERAVEETIRGIADIRGQTLTARAAIDELVARVGRIGEFLDLIAAINQETNLLSLNAAIIAAQAGEHGKAFAVVANHVKTLAQRTAGSTLEIGSLIAAIQSASSAATEAMASGMEAVERGVGRSRRAGETLTQIRAAADQANARVGEISRASQEQTRNSRHVAEAAQRTSERVQLISSAIGEQSRASESLRLAAENALEQCRQVQRGTAEQREAALTIRSAVAAIVAMTQSIQRNTESHSAASESVSDAVNRILEVAQRKRESPSAAKPRGGRFAPAPGSIT